MTKQEFAIKLLFWLFPWPLSTILPDKYRQMHRLQITPSLPPIYYSWPAPGWWDPAWGNFWDFIAGMLPDIPYWSPYKPSDWIEFILNPPAGQPPWWPIDAPPYADFIGGLQTAPPPWWPPGQAWPPSSGIIPPHPPGPGPQPQPPAPTPGLPPSPGQTKIRAPLYRHYLTDEYWEPEGPDIEWEDANQRWKYRCSYESAHRLIPKTGTTWATGLRSKYAKIYHHGDCDVVNLAIYDSVAAENNYLSGQRVTCAYPLGDLTALDLTSDSLGIPWANIGYITDIQLSTQQV